MNDARQKFKLAFFNAKLFAVLSVVFLSSVLCQAQTVATETCDFSRYKPFAISHFLKSALLEQAKPVYPPTARAVQAQGAVYVRILVDRRGLVRDACAVEGHQLLRAAAVKAARESRFKSNYGLSLPQKRYGRRFVTDRLVFNFTLE